MDPEKAIGLKRPAPDGPASPAGNQHSGVGGHLVYVRRKLDNDHSKSSPSQDGKKAEKHTHKEQTVQQHCVDVSKPALSPVASVSEAAMIVSLEKPAEADAVPDAPAPSDTPINSAEADTIPDASASSDTPTKLKMEATSDTPTTPTTEATPAKPDETPAAAAASSGNTSAQPDETMPPPPPPPAAASGNSSVQPDETPEVAATTTSGKSSSSPVQDDSNGSSMQYWKDRLVRLQSYLDYCDQSGQDNYIMMFRSLSAAGRNKHAFDLERRAIHLLLEEGKELQRMKALNIFEKNAPSDEFPSVATTQAECNGLG